MQMENLPTKASPATTIEDLRALRDSTEDQDVKRLARWAIKQIENAPRAARNKRDEMHELEIQSKKYDYYAKLAKTFASSKMVDQNMGEADLFYVIEMGDSVGLSAPQAIQSIASINGKPSLWGDGLLAVVRNSRECESIREETKGTIEDGDAEAVCITKRRGEDEVARTFSLADATRAGLYPAKDRNGNLSTSSPWAKYPMRMLQMRARAWCLRDVYADVLRGFSSAEEQQDIQYANVVDITPDDDVPEPELKPKATSHSDEVIEASIEKVSGNLESSIEDINEAETMADLLKAKDSVTSYEWTTEEQEKLNAAYRDRRAKIKEAANAEVQSDSEDAPEGNDE
jgi:hypothetical protein